MSLEEFLQASLGRWGIEVNFHEEKNLVGTGTSNQHLPAITVAGYAFLWVAALLARRESQPLALLRPPKWRKAPPPRKTDRRPSTGDLLRLLRAEISVRALKTETFDHFATDPPPGHERPENQPGAISHALRRRIINNRSDSRHI